MLFKRPNALDFLEQKYFNANNFYQQILATEPKSLTNW